MEKEISALIKKNLPAQVGEKLKEVLQEGERNAELVIHQSKMINERNLELAAANALIQKYKEHDNRNAALDAREQSLNKQEREIKIATLEYQLKSEMDKTAFAKEVALGLVRNTEYRKHIFDCENQAGYTGAGGQWIQPASVNKSFNETKTEA